MDERGGEKFRFYGGRKGGKRQSEEEWILTIKQTWLLLNSPTQGIHYFYLQPQKIKLQGFFFFFLRK